MLPLGERVTATARTSGKQRAAEPGELPQRVRGGENAAMSIELTERWTVLPGETTIRRHTGVSAWSKARGPNWS